MGHGYASGTSERVRSDMDEKLEALLSAIQSKVNTLIGKSSVMSNLRPAHGDLIELGTEIDDLINEYQESE